MVFFSRFAGEGEGVFLGGGTLLFGKGGLFWLHGVFSHLRKALEVFVFFSVGDNFRGRGGLNPLLGGKEI